MGFCNAGLPHAGEHPQSPFWPLRMPVDLEFRQRREVQIGLAAALLLMVA
jgi:hypothetical protein